MLYKDVCGEDLVKTIGILRAIQLGYVPEIVVQHAIDYRGEGLDVETLLSKVQEYLPTFGRSNAS